MGGVIFLSVPESLRGAFEGEGGFRLDPDIPLPVEVPENGIPSDAAALEDLSWEMIVSGMLRVISGEGSARPEWMDYYRAFALALRPSLAAELSDAAALKAAEGEFEAALEILDSLDSLLPESPVVALNRALALERRAQAIERRLGPDAELAYGEAEKSFARAMALGPAFVEARLNAGFFYLGRKDFARARECLVACVEDERAGSIVREIDRNGLADEDFARARALILAGEEEAGMLELRGFIERRPNSWNGWFALGWALRRLERWADAAAAFSKAVEEGGGNSDTRNELAICLMETGDEAGARRQLEAALRDDCDNVKVISNLGVLAMRRGDFAEAAAFFRAALDIEPQDALAADCLKKIEAAEKGA
ncbi:MAG: tetratricopeptide repeat protein [Treponema sp.]|nr:tetratricopeptide repeat protein [Treponema sp.]